MKYLSNLGAYNKAVAATLGSASATLVALLGLTDTISPAVSGWLTAGAGALTAASVFLVRNQALVDEVAAEADAVSKK